MRSDGTSEQGLWCNNNLVEEFCIEMQELLTFQAAVQRGEIIATKAEAHANAAAAVGGGKVSKLSMVKNRAFDDDDGQEFDPISSEYIEKLMVLLMENSQSREVVHLSNVSNYEAERKRAEEIREQQLATEIAYAAARAGDSDSGDDGPAYCTLGTAFFAGRSYFGDSPVNVGIEFNRNSRPSCVKEVKPQMACLVFSKHANSRMCSFRPIIMANLMDSDACGNRLEAKVIAKFRCIKASSGMEWRTVGERRD